jgi:hypothetical protein
MIAFHDCYYAAIFLAGGQYFRRRLTKILERVQYFRRLVEPTKISTIIFIGLRDRQNKLYRFRRLVEPTKIHYTVSSALLANENRFIFIGCRRKRVHFHRFYSVGLFSSVHIFDGFRAIFDGFWLTKFTYFLVVTLHCSAAMDEGRPIHVASPASCKLLLAVAIHQL